MKQKDYINTIYSFWAPLYDTAHHIQTLWADSKYRKIVAKSANLKAGDLVLDISTGTGLNGLAAIAQEPSINIFGVDLNPSMLKKALINIKKCNADKNFPLINADMESLPFKENSFDAIISTYGLGGIENLDDVLKEIKRVAKPDARIAAIEMTSPLNNMRFKKFLHNYLVEPWVKLFWGFRDINLEELFNRNNIEVFESKFYDDYFLGSSRLVYGKIKK